MKKNKMMRLASGLLVAVLITTSTISGTFAKYVSKAEAHETARVAKWGVTIEATSAPIFLTEYASADATIAEDVDKLSVKAGTKVVAPGTSGELAAFTVTGTPEVDFRLNYTSTIELGTEWKDQNGDFYCPLVFVVDGVTVDSTGCADADAFETKIKEEIDREVYYDITTASTTYETFDITWNWEYHVDNDTDLKDTALGDAGVASIDFKVVCTAEQVD